MKSSIMFSALFGVAALAAGASAFADSAPAAFKDGVLVDPRGMTLYTFDKDPLGAGKSVCIEQCAAVWPPLAASAGSAVDGDFSVIERDDGGRQIAHQGRPLYRYVSDQKPGDSIGDDSGGVWHAVRAQGQAPKPAGSANQYGY